MPQDAGQAGMVAGLVGIERLGLVAGLVWLTFALQGSSRRPAPTDNLVAIGHLVAR